MIRVLSTTAVLVLLLTFGPSRAQESRPLPFTAGETLTYDVTWSAFSAGRVTATLRKVGEDAGDDYEIITTARSRGFVSFLFNLNDEFHSLFDPRTLCSHQISKVVNEGRRHKQTRIVFNNVKKLAILDERDLGKPNTPAKHAENRIPGCVQDVVSAFYFVRGQPLQVGEQIRVPLNDGAKTTEVTAEVQAREEIQTPLGKRVVFRVEPKVFGNLYKRSGRMLIWFSDDEQRLPVRIKAMISVGTITGALESVTNPSAASPALEP